MASVFVVVNVLQVELCMGFAVYLLVQLVLVLWVQQLLVGADADAAGATLPMFDVSGLTASE